MKKVLLTLSGICFCMCVTSGLLAKEIVKTSNTTSKSPDKALSFIENKGQIVDQDGKHRNDIDYKLQANGMTMFVDDAQLHYQWSRSEKSKKEIPNSNINVTKGQLAIISGQPFPNSQSSIPNSKTEFYRMDVELVGGNKNAPVITEDQQDYVENYYLPQCPVGATAHSYTKVTYKNVYPNVDWVVYVANSKSDPAVAGPNSNPTQARLKYDFIVHPGGDISQIKLRYDGATSLKLKDGALIATTPFGSITENAPYSYYAGSKEQVNSSFKLNGNILSYNISSPWGRPGGATLIIDPALKWGTYYGGSGDDQGRAGTVDTAGNVYMCGLTNSLTNVATSGAHQTTYGGGGMDGLIVKFDMDGAPQWATYYGGSSNEELYSICTDSSNNVYISGYTLSPGLATGGSFKDTITLDALGGGADALLIKLDGSGVRLWATYFGGEAFDIGFKVASDGNGNVYIGGMTESPNNIATPGAFQTTYSPAPLNGYLARFDSSGSEVWSTYYNGEVVSIACDTGGIVYIGGFTYDSVNVATSGAYQDTFPPDSYNGEAGFFASFTSAGTRSWGTYYNAMATIKDILPDRHGNIYLCGSTISRIGVATGCAHRSNHTPYGFEGFLTKFTTSGRQVWGTYYGGSGGVFSNTTAMSRMALDPQGDVYVTGTTYCAKGIATTGAYKANISGGSDVFLARFSAAGKRKWATYYGGSDMDGNLSVVFPNLPGEGVCAYVKDRIFISGTTASSTGIATSGAYQTALGGNNDIFVAQFVPDTEVSINQSIPDTLLCAGDTLRLPYNTDKFFNSSNTFKVQLSDSWGSFASAAIIGTLAAQTDSIIKCKLPDTLSGGTGYRMRIIATSPADTSDEEHGCGGDGGGIHIKPGAIPVASVNLPVCIGATLAFNVNTSRSGAVFSWSGPGSYSSTQQNPGISNVQSTHAGDYVVTTSLNGCSAADTVTVVVNPVPAVPVAASNSPICAGANLNFTASSTTTGVSYSWSGPNGPLSSLQNPVINNAQTAHAGDYIVTTSLNGCTTKDTVTVVVNLTPAKPTVTNNGPACEGVSLYFFATSTATGVAYSWSGPNGFSSNMRGPGISSVQAIDAGKYVGTAKLGNCSSSDTTVVVIYPSPATLTVTSNSPICEGADLNFTANSTKPGVTYKWSGSGFSSLLQNPVVANATAVAAGTYTLIAKLGTCYDSVKVPVVVNAGPTVAVDPGPDDSICAGDQLTLTCVSTPAASGIAFQWQKGGVDVPGATAGSYLPPAVADGDVYSVKMTPAASFGCSSPVNSDTVKIAVLPLVTPVVSVTADDANAWPGRLVTFIATATDAGTVPKYQWKLNGADINGATSTTWAAATLSNDDNVCVEVTSNYPCPNPATVASCKKVGIATGISNVANKKLHIYPNPASTEVTIEGITIGTKIQLNDVYGRIMYSTVATKSVTTVNVAGLVPASYILQLTGNNGERDSYKLVKE